MNDILAIVIILSILFLLREWLFLVVDVYKTSRTKNKDQDNDADTI
jgi:hypothetical protein